MATVGEEHCDLAAAFAVGMGWGCAVTSPTESQCPRLVDRRKQQLKTTFQLFDADGNGFISRDELTIVLGRLGHFGSGDIDKLMAEADTNQDGKIEIDEFVSWLTAGVTEGRVVLEYGDALKPLFDVFDRGNDGYISRRDFIECHGILQGALALNPVEDEQHEEAMEQKIWMAEGEAAFAHLDTGGDGTCSFAEFAGYMKGMIDKSRISPEDLQECTTKLAHSLRGVISGINMAEAGHIAEDQPEILEHFVKLLAKSTRELQAALEANCGSMEVPSEIRSKWLRPPSGLSVADVKMMHMGCVPLNMRLVHHADFEVICIPTPKPSSITDWKEDSDSDQKVWLAEVFRNIEFKSKNTRKEKRRYYTYDVEQGGWSADERLDAREDFDEALKSLAPELGMFYLLQTNADFGTELQWPDVKRSMYAGVDMGWITTDQRLCFRDYMREKVCQDLIERDKESGSPKELTKEEMESRAKHFLFSKVIVRPRAIMATLSKLGIMKVNPTWQSFMREA